MKTNWSIRKTEKDFDVVYDQPLENNLYNRLKPEYDAKLDAEATVYPNGVAHLRRALKDHDNFLELPYGTVISLSAYLGIKMEVLPLIFKS